MTTQTLSEPAVRNEDAEVMKVLGRALAVLRTRRGLHQAQAGAAIGTTGQGWGRYENGLVAAIFRPSVQRRLVAALGVTMADLRTEVDALAPKPADEDWVSRDFLQLADAQ